MSGDDSIEFDDLVVRTRPAVPLDERTRPEHWITDETARDARRLWEQNRGASQIECALIVASEAIAPLCERDATSRASGGPT